MDFFRVFLHSSLYENLLCYTLDPHEGGKIDPNPEKYFLHESEESVLPEGQYFFVQFRKENLNANELLCRAVELQKEALWERHKITPKLFVRNFFEDNSPVTQLWRPITS